MIDGRCRPSDVLVLRHKGGEPLYFVNLVGMGFAADVSALDEPVGLLDAALPVAGSSFARVDPEPSGPSGQG